MKMAFRAAASLALLASTAATAPLVNLEQFGMPMCPMTSTWQYEFYNNCILHGTGIQQIVNYTNNIVGGTHGGPVTNTSWNSSFHGDVEIVADKYQLCAETLHPYEPSQAHSWIEFLSCLTGQDGIGICTLYAKGDVTKHAEKCALTSGLSWPSLQACAEGEQGAALFKASVFYTSDEQIKYDAPDIPVIRINGKIYKGLNAYSDIGERVCGAYTGAPPAGCGCHGNVSVPHKLP